jgi:hypothetical protein
MAWVYDAECMVRVVTKGLVMSLYSVRSRGPLFYALSTAATLCTVGGATVAQAATVQVVQGDVLVNQGKGYRKVAGSTVANIGDSVIVRGKGAARIIYSNGCTTVVDVGVVQTVVADEACLLGLTNSAQTVPAGTAGAAGAAGVITPEVIIGGALIGGGIAAAIALSDNGSSP